MGVNMTGTQHIVPILAQHMKLIMREGNGGCQIYKQGITGNFTYNNTHTYAQAHTLQRLPEVHHWS